MPDPQLPFIPSLSQFRSDLRRENGNTDPLLGEDSLQPPRHVALLRMDGEDLYLSPLLK
jgi:hypothetical protein